jgi:hypothetical protein
MKRRSIWFALVLLISSLAVFAVPVVNLTIGTNVLTEGLSRTVTFSASDSSSIQVYFEVTGTAVVNYDYTIDASSPVFMAGNYFATLRTVSHPAVSPARTVSVRLLPNDAYILGTNSQVTVTILDTATVAGTNSVTVLQLNSIPSLISQRSNLVATASASDPDARHLFIQLLANGQAVAESSAWATNATNVTLIWTNPPAGAYTISATAYDDRGRGTNSRSYQLAVAVDILPPSETNAIIWKIPANATNLEGFVRFNATSYYTNRFYVFDPDSTDPPEFLGEAIGYPKPDPYWLFDVTPWLQRLAGKRLGIFGEQGSLLSDFQLVLTTPSTFQRAPRVEWIQEDRAYLRGDVMQLRARVISPEATVWNYTITFGDKLWSSIDTNLPPGTNIVTVTVPALTPGANLFKMYVSSPGWFVASDTLTNNVVNTLPNPEHTWLASDGKSFFVVDAAGRVRAWGDNSAGQLGAGFVSGTNNPIISTPVTIEPPAGLRFRQVVSSGRRTYALTDSGQLYGWGANENNNLISSPAPFIPEPVKVPLPYLAYYYSKIRDRFSLDQDGRLWSGRSPRTTFIYTSTRSDDFDANSGVVFSKRGAVLWTDNGSAVYSQVPFPLGVTNWLAYSVSPFHWLMIGNDRQLYGLGANSQGELPATNGQFQVTSPIKAEVPGVDAWLRVAAGPYVNLAVDSKDRLFWWGRGFGLSNTNENPSQPMELEFLKGKSGWLDLTVTSANAMALSEQGEVFVWGLAGVQKIEGLGDLLDANAPPPPANFVSSYFVDGQPTARVVGPKGVPVIVETSIDLIHWEARPEIPNPSGLLEIPLGSGGANLFFRIAAPR